tara:strand:+ start:3838 stop:4803 length:966 start_codon:yes stop_codon:yes gene_type:complete
MTSILADHQYDLRHFPQANNLNINAILSQSVIDNINRLASRVGAPTYQKTPVFMKRDKQHRRPPRQRQVISGADWEEIRNFKTTELEKKEEGVEKDIDELRGLLNKLTSTNFEDMQKNIMTSLTNIMNKNCKEEDLEKIGEAIFEIGSINKFWSALYAKLYKGILNAFPAMNNIYQKNFNNFMLLFSNIRFVPAEENYDEFCKVNKENEKRRSMGSFFVHLMNNEVIAHTAILDLIETLKNNMLELIDQDNKKEEVEEFGENIVILIDGGKDILESSTREDGFTWDDCVEFVEAMTKRKVANHPSLSNKVVFKFMDLEEEF